MPSNSWLNGWITGDIPSAAEFKKGVGCVFDSTLGIATATIDTGAIIPTTYAALMVEIVARGDTAATSAALTIRFNNDSGANYNHERINGADTAITSAGTLNAASILMGGVPAATAPANAAGIARLEVPNYGGTTFFKVCGGTNHYETADTAAGQTASVTHGMWKSTAAITRITAGLSAGNFLAGSRMTVYVKGA